MPTITVKSDDGTTKTITYMGDVVTQVSEQMNVQINPSLKQEDIIKFVQQFLNNKSK